jgi:hypothetical protein
VIKGTWLQKLRIRADDIWEKVKDGEYKGLSIVARSNYIKLDEDNEDGES